MLVYKAAQVVSASPIEKRDYSFKGNSGDTIAGTSIASRVTVIGQDGQVAVIKVKGKTEDDVKAKLAKLTPGKPAEIVIRPDNQESGVAVLTA